MKINRFIILPAIMPFLCLSAQEPLPVAPDQPPEADLVLEYKKTEEASLKLYLFYPENFRNSRKYPAIVFFFGGGWNGGDIRQFEPHARHFASRGIVGVLAEYRVRNRHGTTPFDAVSDARSAIRYLRQHADQLKIDMDKIVAAGGSAGGHLAAAAATVPGLDAPDDNLSISPVPGALVLFNPVFDNGPGGYGYERIGDRYPEISPIHNIRHGTPPTIVFLGTKDHHIPVSAAEKYKELMENAGNRCDLHLFEGQTHGFFNYRRSTEYYMKTLLLADDFLVSLRYLKKRKGPRGKG